MNRATHVAVILASAVIGGAVGFWAGLKEGLDLGVKVEAAPRGLDAVEGLRALDSGRLGIVRANLETDADMGLISWDEVSRSPLRLVLDPILGLEVYPENEKYVSKIAVYRRDHPSPILYQSGVDSLPDDFGAAHDEYPQLLKEIVERYAPSE